MKLKIYIFLLVITLILDILLGNSKYPIFSLILCGIFVLYVAVSPYIRI